MNGRLRHRAARVAGAISEGGLVNWSIFAAGVAATAALALLLGREARRRLKL